MNLTSALKRSAFRSRSNTSLSWARTSLSSLCTSAMSVAFRCSRDSVSLSFSVVSSLLAHS